MIHNTPESAFSIPCEHGTDYASWFIKKKADELVGHFGITEQDRDDIEQRLTLDLLERWPKFDPARSKATTFAAYVIRHKVSTIIREELAERRLRARIKLLPISKRIREEVEFCLRIGIPTRRELEHVELEHDVQAVLETLSAADRELCERLKAGSLAEVARDMGVPRSTLNYRVEKIRKVFERHNMRDFVA